MICIITTTKLFPFWQHISFFLCSDITLFLLNFYQLDLPLLQTIGNHGLLANRKKNFKSFPEKSCFFLDLMLLREVKYTLLCIVKIMHALLLTYFHVLSLGRSDEELSPTPRKRRLGECRGEGRRSQRRQCCCTCGGLRLWLAASLRSFVISYSLVVLVS